MISLLKKLPYLSFRRQTRRSPPAQALRPSFFESLEYLGISGYVAMPTPDPAATGSGGQLDLRMSKTFLPVGLVGGVTSVRARPVDLSR